MQSTYYVNIHTQSKHSMTLQVRVKQKQQNLLLFKQFYHEIILYQNNSGNVLYAIGFLVCIITISYHNIIQFIGLLPMSTYFNYAKHQWHIQCWNYPTAGHANNSLELNSNCNVLKIAIPFQYKVKYQLFKVYYNQTKNRFFIHAGKQEKGTWQWYP